MNQGAQKGVGLVEVMVAALLIAVAVLGFIALQYRALEAANEAYSRTQAMNIARDLSERIRANHFAISDYASALNNQIDDEAELPASPKICNKNNQGCTAAEFSEFDVTEVKKKAEAVGMQVAMSRCYATTTIAQRYCIYVAWEATSPDEVGSTACTQNGNYRSGSKCIVMEAYS